VTVKQTSAARVSVPPEPGNGTSREAEGSGDHAAPALIRWSATAPGLEELRNIKTNIDAMVAMPSVHGGVAMPDGGVKAPESLGALNSNSSPRVFSLRSGLASTAFF
jgi:hypothetical protein